MLFAHGFEQLLSFRWAVRCLVCCLAFPLPAGPGEPARSAGTFAELTVTDGISHRRFTFVLTEEGEFSVGSRDYSHAGPLTALDWGRCLPGNPWVFILRIRRLFYNRLPIPNSYLEQIHRTYSSSHNFFAFALGFVDLLEKWRMIFTVLCGCDNTT